MIHRSTCFIVMMVLVLAAMPPARAVIRSVPIPYTSIQLAINACNNGDIVEVDGGTYIAQPGFYDIDFLGKSITVRSVTGSAGTTLNLNYAGRGFQFVNGEGRSSILEGFTVQFGWPASFGAGVYCDGTSPLVVDCVFEYGYAPNLGGGAVYCVNGAAPYFSQCSFLNNDAVNRGGAVCAEYSAQPVFDFCTFSGNSADLGGAICCENSCQIELVNTLLLGNTAADKGGALYSHMDCPGSLTNCLLVGNSASGTFGGAIYAFDLCPLDIKGCTFSGNIAAISGGAIWYGNGSRPTIWNCILWGDTPQEIYRSTSSPPPAITYSDNQGNTFGDPTNLDADPLFVTGPLGDYYLSQIPSGQGSNSPCMNTGGGLAVDFCFSGSGTGYCQSDFTTRTDEYVDLGVVDMGYHYPPSGFVPPPLVPATTPLGTGLLLVGMGLYLRRRGTARRRS